MGRAVNLLISFRVSIHYWQFGRFSISQFLGLNIASVNRFRVTSEEKVLPAVRLGYVTDWGQGNRRQWYPNNPFTAIQ